MLTLVYTVGFWSLGKMPQLQTPVRKYSDPILMAAGPPLSPCAAAEPSMKKGSILLVSRIYSLLTEIAYSLLMTGKSTYCKWLLRSGLTEFCVVPQPVRRAIVLTALYASSVFKALCWFEWVMEIPSSVYVVYHIHKVIHICVSSSSSFGQLHFSVKTFQYPICDSSFPMLIYGLPTRFNTDPYLILLVEYLNWKIKEMSNAIMRYHYRNYWGYNRDE